MQLPLPDSAFFGQNIPKNKLITQFQKTKKSGVTDFREELSENIDKIIWKYKISASTIGIRETENIKEIQVFEIILKNQNIPKNVIKILDVLIPYPILYVFCYENHLGNNFAFGISLKKSGIENTGNKYLFSSWNEKIDFSFSAITTDILYENICKKFIKKPEEQQKENINKTIKTSFSSSEQSHKPEQSEQNFAKIIQNHELKNNIQKEIQVLQSKMKKEKSLSKRHEIHMKIREKTQELNAII